MSRRKKNCGTGAAAFPAYKTPPTPASCSNPTSPQSHRRGEHSTTLGDFFFHNNPKHPLRRCITLRRGRRCPTRNTCRSATRRRAASMHACSRRCAVSAAMRPASAASTASAAAATKPGRHGRRPQGAAETHRPPTAFHNKHMCLVS